MAKLSSNVYTDDTEITTKRLVSSDGKERVNVSFGFSDDNYMSLELAIKLYDSLGEILNKNKYQEAV